MSFAGVVLACWLGIAAVAFLALSALARVASRDADANLGIVGNAELRVLLGERDEDLLPLEARLGRLGIPSAQRSGGLGYASLSLAPPVTSRMMDGGRDLGSGWESVGASYTR